VQEAEDVQQMLRQDRDRKLVAKQSEEVTWQTPNPTKRGKLSRWKTSDKDKLPVYREDKVLFYR